MTDDTVAIGADVDVRALMDEIHDEIRRKRAAGLYPPHVLEELDVVLGVAGVQDDDIAAALTELRRSSGFSSEVTIASRKPYVGPAVSKVKGGIRVAVRWYINGILQQLNGFAGNVVRTTGVLAAHVRRLGERLDAADPRLDGLEDAARVYRSELDGMRAELDRLHRQADDSLATHRHAEERIGRLDRAAREMRNRLEDPLPARVDGDAHGAPSWQAERTFDYFEFENHFRGSEESIRDRQRLYVELFRTAPGRVVDLGCGRGEFLEVLRQEGIASYGVDRHPDMVGHVRDKGLDVVQADSMDHLASVPSASLGAIFSCQMIEHLEIRDVPRFFDLCADALAPGGVLAVETINPRSLFVFAHAFYVDLGHTRPLHPYALEFLARMSGFAEVRVEYLFPPPPEFRPQPVEPQAGLDALVDRVNDNFRRIDDIVFGPQDYAVVATR